MTYVKAGVARRRLGVPFVSFALTAVALLVWTAPAARAGGLAKYEIVPGESIGYVKLGMSRKAIQRKLGNPIQRSHDAERYYLTYRYPARDRNGNRGEKLTIVFRGLSLGANAVYMVTLESSLGTRQGIGVGDSLGELKGAYAVVACYHKNSEGSRDPGIDDNENFECELPRNGGFTYFAFHSLDADPGQRIGALAIATRRVN